MLRNTALQRAIIIPAFCISSFLAGAQEYTTSDSLAKSVSETIEDIGNLWGKAKVAKATSPKAYPLEKEESKKGFGDLLLAMPRCRSPAPFRYTLSTAKWNSEI